MPYVCNICIEHTIEKQKHYIKTEYIALLGTKHCIEIHTLGYRNIMQKKGPYHNSNEDKNKYNKT